MVDDKNLIDRSFFWGKEFTSFAVGWLSHQDLCGSTAAVAGGKGGVGQDPGRCLAVMYLGG